MVASWWVILSVCFCVLVLTIICIRFLVLDGWSSMWFWLSSLVLVLVIVALTLGEVVIVVLLVIWMLTSIWGSCCMMDVSSVSGRLVVVICFIT